MSRGNELVNKLKELNYKLDKFVEIHKYLRGTYQYEFVGSFQVARQAIDIDNLILDSLLLKEYVEKEIIKIRKERASVYLELGRYMEVNENE